VGGAHERTDSPALFGDGLAVISDKATTSLGIAAELSISGAAARGLRY
jgi:hypothetical protein